MKEVILHIGSHKTGTTAIQSSIRNYNFNKTKTAAFLQVNHSIPMYTIFSKNYLNHHIWKKLGFSNEQLNDQTCDTLIISGEAISFLHPDEKISLINFFKNKKLDLKIIYFIRNPFDFCISVFQQRIKGGDNKVSKFFIIKFQ